jgi:threonine-phosphate decarboxylase
MVKKSIICALDSLVHYPDNTHRELKLALGVHHSLSPANIVVANGSTEIIYHLPAMLPGSRALIISPSFNEYVRALGQHHWEVRHFILKPESNFLIDLEALEHTLAEGFDALYLCNPGNPNGTLYNLRTIERIYSLCIASGTFLVLDEAFMDFCEDSSAKHDIVKGDNGIILRSMTKFFGIPGLRLGYALSSSTMAERLDAMGGPWSVNTLALAAGVAALQDSEHNQRTTEYIRQERRNFFNRLSELKQLKVYPSSANFLLVEITDGMPAMELRNRLLHERLLIRDCTNFMGLSPRFFRIAVRTTEENERLLVALKRILK